MRKILISILILSIFITSCGANTSNVFNSKQKGGYNYVKDNTYYYVSNDGTRYVFGIDSVENNKAYTSRKSRIELQELQNFGFGGFFSGFNFGLTETKSIEERFKEKNYYPNNYINFNNDLTILEYNYDYDMNSLNINISTNSIVKKESVKRLINSEEDLKKDNENNNEIVIDDSVDEKIDSIVLDESEFNPFDMDELFATPSETFISDDNISTESDIDIVDEISVEENNKLESINFIRRDRYYFDEKNNDLYYINNINEFYKYNIYNYNNDLIDDNIENIKIFDKDNIVYYKKIHDNNDKYIYMIVFYSIDKGIINKIEINNIEDVIFDNYNKDIIYYTVNEDNKKLYSFNKKGETQLIDTNIKNVYGKTKKYLYYSKDDEIRIPYSYFLIDNVSSGEWLGEEPKLSNYKLNDDPFSLDFDIDAYTQVRMAYKYKEKFLNDRKKYVEKNIENIKNNDFIIYADKLYSFDGKNTNKINDDYIRNVYIVDSDNDILYFETDNNIYNYQIEKKTLGEFVTSNTMIDNYINNLVEETRKEFLFYVSNNNKISKVHDLEFYRGYVDKMSQLYYDSKNRARMIMDEKRNICFFDNKIYIVGKSYKTDNNVTYCIDLINNKEFFADSINMAGFSNIKFIDYINDPIYILYNNDNEGVLKYGIKDISRRVIVDSVAIDSYKNKIAYVINNDNNINGELHMQELKNLSNDNIVSNNAFYYNIVFDSLTNDLCFLVNFDENEEYGTFLTFDSNNKLNFIDDEVMYILKN